MRALYNQRLAEGREPLFTNCLSPHVAIVRWVGAAGAGAGAEAGVTVQGNRLRPIVQAG